MSKTNYIGHVKKGGSDKVYVVAVVDNGDGTYDCVGRYGRNQGSMKEQVKAKGVSKFAAESAADKLVRSKMHRNKDPYMDIDSTEYRNGLTRDDGWLKKWLEPEEGTVPTPKAVTIPKVNTDPIPPEAVKSKPAKKSEQFEDQVYVCINNAGYEHLFDEGIEYISTKGSLSEDFVTVLDKFNKPHEMFTDRFATVKDAAKRGLVMA